VSNALINLYSKDITYNYPDSSKLSKWLINLINNEGGALESLNIILCSDDHLSELNVKYLDDNSLTDVLTFPYAQHPDKIEGDIYISFDRVKENAAANHVTTNDELHRVIAHGTLHLLGFKDKTAKDKALMTNKEDQYLAQWD